MLKIELSYNDKKIGKLNAGYKVAMCKSKTTSNQTDTVSKH